MIPFTRFGSFFLFGLFLTFVTHAKAEISLSRRPLSLVCAAQEVKVGSRRIGEVRINFRAEEAAPVAIFEVLWQGAPSTPIEMITGPGLVCGVSLPEGMDCENRVSGRQFPFHILQACGIGAIDTRGLPHHAFDSSVTFDSGYTHGFFGCTARDGEKAKRRRLTLELHGCH